MDQRAKSSGVGEHDGKPGVPAAGRQLNIKVHAEIFANEANRNPAVAVERAAEALGHFTEDPSVNGRQGTACDERRTG
ncbi:MAG: hypothetical protein M3066_04560 [Actinomycetota bacterium]|nr:hypothetical protein [Actinomycetota bacterium]